MDFNIEKEGSKIKVKVKFAFQSKTERKVQCTTDDARKLAENMGYKVEKIIQSGLANNFNPRNLSAEFVFQIKEAQSEAQEEITEIQEPQLSAETIATLIEESVPSAGQFTPPGYPFYDDDKKLKRDKKKKPSKKKEE